MLKFSRNEMTPSSARLTYSSSVSKSYIKVSRPIRPGSIIAFKAVRKAKPPSLVWPIKSPCANAFRQSRSAFRVGLSRHSRYMVVSSPPVALAAFFAISSFPRRGVTPNNKPPAASDMPNMRNMNKDTQSSISAVARTSRPIAAWCRSVKITDSKTGMPVL